eukprot:g7795.t1
MRILNHTDPRMTALQDEGLEVHCKVQMLEVYNEKVRDLLVPMNGNSKDGKSRHHPEVHVHPKLGVYVKGVADEPVDSFENCVQLIEYGNTMKTVAATAMNAKSSRAHTIFKLMVEKRNLFAHGGKLEVNTRVQIVRLFEAMNRADQDLRGGRNSTNQTNQIDASCHEYTFFFCLIQFNLRAVTRLLLDISRQRIFVLAGLIASLVILTCGCFWGYRRKSEAGDLEIGTDDLDEVWFRKPAPPGSPASPSPKGLPKGPRRS